jgi:hypothetical protein
MIDTMDRREEESAKEIILPEKSDPDATARPPTAYIPACGTLCDAFWWARRRVDPEKLSD